MRLLDSTVNCYNANGDLVDDRDIGELTSNEEGFVTTEYTDKGFEPVGFARPASEVDVEPESITLFFPAAGEEQGYHVFLDDGYDVNAHEYGNPRCFDPTEGGWLGSSPLGFQAGDDNLYRYHEPRQ